MNGKQGPESVEKRCRLKRPTCRIGRYRETDRHTETDIYGETHTDTRRHRETWGEREPWITWFFGYECVAQGC